MYYMTLAEVNTYVNNHPDVYSKWSAYTDAIKERFIDRSEWIIDHDFKFVGEMVNQRQGHAFPRDFDDYIPSHLDFNLLDNINLNTSTDYKNPLVLYNKTKDIPILKDSINEIVVELVKNSSLTQLKDLQQSVGAKRVSISSISIEMGEGSRIGQAVRRYLYPFLLINYTLRGLSSC